MVKRTLPPGRGAAPIDRVDPARESLVDHFRSILLGRPDATIYRFLVDGEGGPITLTNAELDQRARAIAAVLRDRCAPGERALIVCQPGLDYVASFFACLYAGIIAVPVYPPEPRMLKRTLPRLVGVIEDSRPAVVLAPGAIVSLAGEFTAHAPVFGELSWQAVDAVDPGAADGWQHRRVRGADVAFLQYTSGSTGRPKGVMVSHANLLHNLCAIHQLFVGDEPDPRGVIWLPPYHDMGLIGGLLQPAYGGFPVTFMSPLAFLKRPARWLKAISEGKATMSGGPNFAYELCIAKVGEEERRELDLSSWRLAFTGAEPVRAETIERFAKAFEPCGFRRTAFYPCYGLAEATLMVSGGDRNAEPVTRKVSADALARNEVADPPADEGARVLVGCGSAIPGHRIVIADPATRTRLPPGQIGEIWFSGPSVAGGFWRQPEKSREEFSAFLSDSEEGPFLRTGDLGFLEGGELYVTGRLKDLVIVAGKNHYPHDIERSVEKSDPALRRGAGVAFSYERDGEERLAIVHAIEADPSKLDAARVVSAIRAAVAEEHGLTVHDVALVRAAQIPKTSSGKLQRLACKRSFLDGTLERIAVWSSSSGAGAEAVAVARPPESVERSSSAGAASSAARAEIEQRLLRELAQRLRLRPDDVDPKRPIATYGLQSVDMVGMVGELERWVGRKLPATLAWEYPTVEALAGFLSADAGSDRSMTSPVGPTRGERSDRAAEPIAIVGIGCRFPGANGPEGYWRLLIEGRDAVTEVPASRWKLEDFVSDDPSAPGKTRTRWGGFLEGIDQFDPHFFGISAREAARMDPQQRLLAEVAWEALEDAGLVPERLAGTPTGVFIGIATNDYGQLQAGDFERIDAYTGTGNALSIAANRLSYLFDLRGPSLAVDTACSSSLVSVHQACTSLRQGECSLALAGGVNLILSPALAINFSKAGAMAPDGRCKAFDARANGYVRAEGAGIVVLKPLSRAVADGDPIYAVILGSAVNQDGRTNGLMAPNPHAQEAVIRAAYESAGVMPHAVQYVEAHGTGTLLGDPIEAKALSAVVASGRDPSKPCVVGSVKSNIGHLEAAAGVAGLIKVALMVRHRQVPRSLHFEKPNPHIPFPELSLRVAETLQGWPAEDGPALAGVSSFGFGGTNAHVVVQEAPRGQAPERRSTDRAHVLPLSARTEDALRALAERYEARLASGDQELSAEGVCFAASVRRPHHEHRLACVGGSLDELRESLRAFARGEERPGLAFGGRRIARRPRTAFVFSGQGPRWWPLTTDLLSGEPVFREVIERSDAILRREVEWSLLAELGADASGSHLTDPAVAQPALCAVQVGVAALWRAWGIEPDAVVGHSVGEIAAAQVAGALGLEDALRVALHRGRVIRSAIGKGKMAVVGVTLEKAQQILGKLRHGLISVAASNSPNATVLSGETRALESLVATLDAHGIFCRLLESVDFASHSPQMEPLKDELRRSIAGITARPPQLPIISTVTGQLVEGAALGADYWAENLRQPVLFDRALATLLDASHDTFVEISPHPMLGTAISERMEAQQVPGAVVASLHRDEPSRASMLSELGGLYCAGFPVDWTRLYGTTGRMVKLPSYPWQRQRFWFDDDAEGGGRAAPGRAAPVASGRGPAETGFWDAVVRSDVDALAEALRASSEEQRSALATLLPKLYAWHRNLGQPGTPDPWRYRVVWKAIEHAPRGRPAGPWLIVTPAALSGGELARGLSRALGDGGATVIPVAVPERADREGLAETLRQSLGVARTPRGVVSLLALDEAPHPAHRELPRGAAHSLALAQALEDAGIGAPLWLVTRGAASVAPSDPVANPLQALTAGLGRVVGLEYPERWGGVIDVPSVVDSAALERLTSVLGGAGDEDQLALRPEGLFARRLVRAPLGDGAAPRGYEPRGTVLVTGGTGALGALLARWLARHGAEHLVLTSRRGAAAPGAAELEAELRALGARVTLAACDAADRQAVAALLQRLEAKGSPVRSVFHVAGVVELVKPLPQTTTADFASVVSGKDAGALCLHELLGDRPLDAFVLFSSITGIWGSGHQGAYSAANAYLDALAEHRRGLGLAATSVAWGPWAGKAHEAHEPELIRRGLMLMDADPALAALERVLGDDETTIAIADMDWSRFAPAYAAARARPLLRELPEAERAVNGSAEPSSQPTAGRKRTGEVRQQLLAIEPGRRRRDALVQHCRAEVGRVLKLDPSRVDTTAPLSSMGFDSLLSLELKKRLEASLDVELPATLAWRYPTIDALAPFLAERMAVPLEPPAGAAVPSPAPPGPAGPAEAVDVDRLSDADVEALLLAKLQKIEEA
jgi:acyl transferase domain-containing protein/acyl-CoA synthetase (AMP-forming)/AMP-acid ligase II/acyl carrier protein